MNEILVARHLAFAHPPPGAFQLELEEISIRAGEIHALVGPNGSGKSTLVRLLAGLLAPCHGDILLKDQPIAEMTRHAFARHVAFLPQQPTPIHPLTVEEVVWQGRHPWMSGIHPGTSDDDRAVALAMERCGVNSFRHRVFQTLSGGGQQRVLLASVLAQQPGVILLDEPTSSLDPHHQSEVMQLLREEASRGTGILMITHDLTLAGHFASRMTLLKEGRMVTTGNPCEVLQENRLQEVYGTRIRVIPDPVSGTPCVIPSSGSDPFCRTPQPSLDKATQSQRPHRPWIWLTLGLLSLVTVLLAPCIGAEHLPVVDSFREMLTQTNDTWSIPTRILELRLPRVTMAFLAGMTLACVGAAFQSLLRNPLAEPYTLGIASWASLGAVIGITCPYLSFTLGPISGIQLWAWALSLCGMGLLFALAGPSHGRVGMTQLLLSGITLALLSSALITLVRFLANPWTVRAMDQWMIGGLDVSSWQEVAPALPLLLPGLVLLLSCARALGPIEFGEETAHGRGVNVRGVQGRVYIGGCMATAAVVSVTGPIGFVGLLVPHIARRIVGTDPRATLPASMLMGGILLTGADTLARSLEIAGRGAELPVGILTSLVGAPVFLVLLWKRKT